MKTIVVLGMHRSGTSAITRALAAFGVATGPREHLGNHWEVKSLRNVNVRLLDAANASWDAPPLDEQWMSKVTVEGLPELARERMRTEFGNVETALWKDPRTCLTLPFWRPVFDEDPLIVLIYRHPEEVARSLEERNQFGTGLSFALWERYNFDALRFADGLPTVVVSYADLMAKPREVMINLVRCLRDWRVHFPNKPRTADLGLDPSSRHHVSTAATTLDPRVSTDAQRILFQTLTALDGPHETFSTPIGLLPRHLLSDELLETVGKLRRARIRAEVPDNAGSRAHRRWRTAPGARRARREDSDEY